MAKAGEVWVGIDVGKDHLDVYVRPLGQHVVVANDARGLTTLIERLVPLALTLIVLEANGGDERLAAIALPWPRLDPAGALAYEATSYRRARDPRRADPMGAP